jgi:3-methyladenine DNA glycosylase/8-oxoguanine DNA glycosylase
MKLETISISVKAPFNFHSALNSHGWVDLLPNGHNFEIPSFSRIEETPSGSVVLLDVSAQGKGLQQTINISVSSSHKLGIKDKESLTSGVRHMLRLDEDFSEFYALCKARGGVWKHIKKGIGHLMRSPSVFEDLVKVICTTNIQWGGTRRMVMELVDAFGKPFPENPDRKTFPSPSSIAATTYEEFLQKVRLGYRADYVYRLARQFADGSLSPAIFQDAQVPTEEIRKSLLSIKGIGNYAAASMLMLLGRYDQIPVDTVFRDFVTRKYFKDRTFNLPEAVALYEDWGKWKYLAYWFDMVNQDSAA